MVSGSGTAACAQVRLLPSRPSQAQLVGLRPHCCCRQCGAATGRACLLLTAGKGQEGGWREGGARPGQLHETAKAVWPSRPPKHGLLRHTKTMKTTRRAASCAALLLVLGAALLGPTGASRLHLHTPAIRRLEGEVQGGAAKAANAGIHTPAAPATAGKATLLTLDKPNTKKPQK